MRRPIATNDMGMTVITSEIVSEVGLLCDGAEPPDPCLATVEDLVAAQGGGLYFLTTTGDRVATYRSDADKLLLLGNIDTPDEALFVVGLTLHNGYNYDAGCSGGEAREVPEGYQVRATVFVEHCSDAGMEQHLLSVAREGAVTVVDVEELLPTECPVLP